MNADPLSTALAEIAETKHLLERLIISSESFDYLEAKSALTKRARSVTVVYMLPAGAIPS